MNKLKFEILKLISSNPGKNYSIRHLSQELSKQSFKAHYSRVHEELKKLEKEETIRLLEIGKSRIPKLQLSFETTTKLAQFESEKMNFLDLKTKELLGKIRFQYSERNIDSLALINYEKFKGLNYFELLIILNDEIGGGIAENETLSSAKERRRKEINEKLEFLTDELFKDNKNKEKKIEAKINTLILLKKEEFIPKLFSNEINAIREGFTEHFSFSKPDDFWLAVGLGKVQYSEIPEIQEQGKLTEDEIIYFLKQFGFELTARKEIVSINKNIGIEYLISEILSRNEPRFIEGIPVIISKNLEIGKKINFKELLFLARRKNKINQTGYLLEMTKKVLLLNEKSNKEKINEIEKALEWLQAFKEPNNQPLIQEIKTHKKHDETAKKWFIETNYSVDDFKKRMSEYNAE